MIGRTLSHYRVTAALGAGGMGEVYRATDTSLGREVAIKVLPSEVGHDPERLARFRREAHLLATLNHPHIAAIHGLEEADGQPFLVLELVEGETLAAKIARGPIPVEEAIETAQQIGEALEAAHAKGIVHRDLKPANVKLTPEGKVKVLDFGLAKAYVGDAASASADASRSPTLTYAGTQAGVILGTAAYMSPEQARGRPVDKRADIWAFGVVLFEMLTGRPLYKGETVSDTLAAVLKREPAWTDLPATLPPAVRRLLRRCLAKPPAERLHDMGDARLELLESRHGAPEVSEGPPPARRTAQRLAITALAALALVSSGVAVWSLRRHGAPAGVTRLSLPLPSGHRLTSAPDISRDGRRLAFTSSEGSDAPRLYIRSLDEREPQAIVGTDTAHNPFFSPDGRWIAFFARGQLFKVAIAGGAPVRLAEAPEPLGGTWGEDGTIVYTASLNSGLLRIGAGGGEPALLAQPDGKQEYAFVWPRFLPGARELLFTAWGRQSSLSSLGLPGRERRTVLTNRDTNVAYVSSGHLLLGDESGDLQAMAYGSGQVSTGAAASVLDDIYFLRDPQKFWFAVSDNGTLAYAPGDPSQRSLAFVDQEGRASPATGERALYQRVALSPDGSRIAFQANDRIGVEDLARSARHFVTPEGTVEAPTRSNKNPVWTPDGSRLVFASNRSGNWEAYAKDASGAGPTELVVSKELDQFPESFAPDGTLAFVEIHPQTGADIWILPPAGEPVPWLATPAAEHYARFSPDGRWIAFASDESGRSEVYVQALRGAERIQVSTEGGSSPAWSPRQDRIFYRQGAALLAADVASRGRLAASPPRRLFQGGWELAGLELFAASFAVTGDGARFLMIRAEPGSIPTRIDLVLNWFEELARVVPN